MTSFIDTDWQDAATSNAAKGYPWSTWGFFRDRPGGLHASHATKAEAERFAAEQREIIRPRGAWVLIVTNEGGAV